MSSDNRHSIEGKLGSNVDDSSLAAAAASELTSPLVLLRQLGMAVAADDITSSERKRLAEQLRLTSERALRMTANLSMSSSNQAVLPLEPVNPVSVCQDVVHELSPLFSAHGKSITLQQRTRVPLLVANRRILQRILLGFVDNALPYGSNDHPIQLTINGHRNSVRIGVRDYGPAVPSDIWRTLDSKITRQANAPLASRPQTSGVGLVTVRRLAELMHSTVGIIRHRDGATFYIDLHASNQMSLL